MMEVMRPRSALGVGSAVIGVGRFAVLLLVLGGFFAMHGLAATVGGIQHYNPVSVVGAAAGPSPPASDLAADHQAPPSHGAAPSATAGTHAAGDEPANQDSSHGLMAGCVFILCALILLLAGQLMRATHWSGHHRLVRMPTGRCDSPPERPPPRPIYLSLCLLRL